MIEFSAILAAFEFVNFGSYGMNNALLDPETGKTDYQSDMSGIGYFDEEDVNEEDVDMFEFIEIPHKKDLNVGRNLTGIR